MGIRLETCKRVHLSGGWSQADDLKEARMKSNTFQMLMLGTVVGTSMLISLLGGLWRMLFGRRAPQVFGYFGLGIILAVLAACYADDAMVRDPYEQIIRDQFHLPDRVKLGTVGRTGKTPVCWLDEVRYSAQVQFTEEQFGAYAKSLDDPKRWSSINRKHYGEESRFSIESGALEWTEVPEPLSHLDDWWVGRDVRRGKVFCFDLAPNCGRSSGPATYRVTGCDARARTKGVASGGGHVQAALDFDNRRLNVYMRFGRKGAYCNNRAMNALNDWLGLDATGGHAVGGYW